MVPIVHILNAITILIPPEHVSSLHNSLALLCLKSKCLQHALPVISRSFTQISEDTKAIQVMTYNYYRGTIFLGLEMYDAAIEAYRKVLS